jgi:GT2 family glycosyltransferase
MSNSPDKSLRLSIVIVNWNTVDLLRDCLDSVFANLPPSTSVVVVDNNSSDSSVAMVEQQFPEVCLIKNDKNVGFAAANNQAFESLMSEYVLLLNSDTVVFPNTLENVVQHLSANPDVAAAGCRVLNKDRSIQYAPVFFPSLINLVKQFLAIGKFKHLSWLDTYEVRSWARNTLRDVEVIPGCFLMVRTNVLKQLGGFDEGFFFYGEETDLCKRILNLGWRLQISPSAEIIHLGGGSVKRLNHKRDVMLSSAIIKLHLKHSGVSTGVLAYIIILAFNFSRAVFWSMASFLRPTIHNRERMAHFVGVVRNARNIWPSKGSSWRFV